MHRLFVSIGESSGDRLAAEILYEFRAISEKLHEKTSIFGIGGPHVLAEGLEPLKTLDDVEGAGLVELLPVLGRLASHILDLRGHLGRRTPDLALMVDAPELQRLLLPPLRRRRVPTVCVVPPQVWAWRKGRLKQLHAYDKVFSLFPFETRFLREHGVAAECIGHPLARTISLIDEKRHGGSSWNILLFPGSRNHEIARNLSWYAEAAELLRKQAGRPVKCTVVAAERKRELVERLTDRERFSIASRNDLEKLLKRADLAWSKLGTSTLEIALSGVPLVAAHRAHPVSEALVERLATTRHFALPNLVLDRRAVPELLGPAATSERLCRVSLDILGDARYRWKCRQQAQILRDELTVPGDPPARRVASYLWKRLTGHEGML